MYLSDNKDDFLNFSKELYAGDPFYATKLEDISECENLFIVKEGDKVLARAGIFDGNPAQIGFFEAENNFNAVKFLFDEIKKYASQKGYDYLI